MALISTSLDLGTLNADGTFTQPSAAITQGGGTDADGIKVINDSRIFYDGEAATAEITTDFTTELDTNGVITGTDCTYMTGELVSGNGSTTTSGASINLDRCMLILTRIGGPVRQFNTDGGFNVTNSQILFTRPDYGNARLQYNIRGSGGVNLSNTIVQPGYRDDGETGAVELVIRVDADVANLAGLTLGRGVFFQPQAPIPLPQVTLSAIFVATNPALRTVIDTTSPDRDDVGYVPWWDCSFAAWETTNILSLQSNAGLGQQVNVWIVNGVFPQDGTTLIVQGNSAGDGTARSVSAWRPLFSVQPNTDASIDFISSPTGVFLKPLTTVTLGQSGVPVTHAVATSDIPDTSANNVNGYLIQPDVNVAPANNVSATLTRSDISTQQVRIWDYANNTPWLINGLTETPTVNLDDGNAANGTFADGSGQQINNAVDPLITEATLATAAASLSGNLDTIYQTMKARWTQSRNALPFLTTSVGDEATIPAALNITAAGVMDFGARNFIINTSTTAFNPSPTGSFFNFGLGTGNPQLTAGTFFNTIQTTGHIDIPNGIGPGMSLIASTITNLPTTLGADTTWSGTFTTTSTVDTTYDMTGADISDLVFVNNGTGTVSIVGAAESDFNTAPSGTGTIIFPFDWSFSVDRAADVTILHNDGSTVTTFLNTTGETVASSTLDAGDYTIVANTAGFLGTPQTITVARDFSVSLTTLDLSLVGYPSSTPLSGRGSFTYTEETYNTRPTFVAQQIGGSSTIYEPAQGLRLFGDFLGHNDGTDNLMGNVIAKNYAAILTAQAAGTISVAEVFSLNADGVVRIRFPVIRLRTRSPQTAYSLFASTSEALGVDGDFVFIDGYTGNATIGGTATATPPTGIQASSLDAAGDSIVARVGADLTGVNTNVTDQGNSVRDHVTSEHNATRFNTDLATSA